MWNEKRKLVKHAANLAKEKHPDGFTKSELIDCSKEVFGGFAANPLKSVKTMEDVNHMGNAMAQIDGHYSVGMSGCYVVGLNGGCGVDCPVFLEGDCGEPQEFTREDITDVLDEDQAESVFDMYACFDKPVIKDK